MKRSAHTSIKVKRDGAALDNAQYIKEVDGKHRRIVERELRVLPVSDWIKEIDNWQGIQSVIELPRAPESKNWGGKPVNQLSDH